MNPDTGFEFRRAKPDSLMPKLEAQNGFALTHLGEWDTEALLQFANNNGGSRAKFVPQLGQIETFYDALKMIGDPGFSTYGYWKDEYGPLVGLATVAQDKADRISLGFIVDEKFRRQSIATNIVKAVSENYFKIPYINTIRCEVNVMNEPSRRLLESLGFRKAGERLYVSVLYDLHKPDAKT